MSNTRNLAAAFAAPRLCADGAGGLGPAQVIERPEDFPPEAAHYRIHRRYMVDKRYYGHQPGARMRPPLRGTMTDPYDPNCWLLTERNDAEFDNLLFFTRTFGNLPRAWTRPGNSNVALPAIDTGPELASAATITAVARVSTGAQFTTSGSHGYSPGDRVQINVRYQLTYRYGLETRLTGDDITITGNFELLTASGTTFVVPNIPVVSNNNSVVFGTAQKFNSGYPTRPVRNLFVTTAVERTYFILGVSPGIQTWQDIPLAQPFAVEKGTEDPAEWPDNTLSANTVPTAAQYWAMIQARSGLVHESGLEEVLGALICRRTSYWNAQ